MLVKKDRVCLVKLRDKESAHVQTNIHYQNGNVIINPFFSARILSKDKAYISRLNFEWKNDKFSIGANL